MQLSASEIVPAAASVLQRMRVHMSAGWPWALVWMSGFAGAVFAAQTGQAAAAASAFLVSFIGLIFWEAAVLRKMTGSARASAFGLQELRYAVSFLLYAIILMFGAVIILFPVIMATMALWALVNFEFETPEPTQEELAASFEAFQAHPLFIVCVAIFMIGLAGLFTLMMRGRAYAAASIAEQRIVAMEAFNWTRTHGLFLLAVGLLALLPALLAAAISIIL